MAEIVPETAALELLNAARFGILATHSLAIEGFPFGSLTPYGLDGKNCPLVYLSGLAQHTKNILANNRVALTVVDPHATDGDRPLRGRLSWIGRATALPDGRSETEPFYDAYFSRFPDNRQYRALDFTLFRIEPVKIHYIAGFGRIFWLEPEAILEKG